MSKKIVDQINSRGIANGWHSQQFARKYEREAQANENMAQFFDRTVATVSSAFNVYALAIQAIGRTIVYQFADGSKGRYALPNSKA